MYSLSLTLDKTLVMTRSLRTSGRAIVLCQEFFLTSHFAEEVKVGDLD